MGNLEVMLFDLQTKLRANNQQVYVPPEGRMVSEITKVSISELITNPYTALPSLGLGSSRGRRASTRARLASGVDASAEAGTAGGEIRQKGVDARHVAARESASRRLRYSRRRRRRRRSVDQETRSNRNRYKGNVKIYNNKYLLIFFDTLGLRGANHRFDGIRARTRQRALPRHRKNSTSNDDD